MYDKNCYYTHGSGLRNGSQGNAIENPNITAALHTGT